MHSATRSYEIHKPAFFFTVLLTLVAVGPLSAKYGGGGGTPANPYLIYDANQMNAIGTDINDWNKCFKLMADIDLGGFTGTSYNIIGKVAKPFTGVFDGNGLTISNFTYDSNGTQFIGLFGYIVGEAAEIKNVTLINPDVNVSMGITVGSLAGYSYRGNISNCRVEDGRVSGESSVGGLVGFMQEGSAQGCYSNCAVDANYWDGGGLVGEADDANINNCTAAGDVQGGIRIGGLIGYTYSYMNYTTVTGCRSSGATDGNESVGGLVGQNEGIILDCCAIGDVRGRERVGGLVGYNLGTVQTCYATGDVNVIHDGIAGGLAGGNVGDISGSFATGSVRGSVHLGGLVGFHWMGTIVDCYSSSRVTGFTTGSWHVGGLLGSLDGGLISRCYSVGRVTATNNFGGLVGTRWYGGTVENSFWDTQTSGTTISAAGIGKTTVQMQTLSTYADASWDFNTPVWKIPCPNDYPRLTWETGPYHPYSGCGTEDDPFLIYTAEEMQAIGTNLGDRGKHFALMADINLADLNGVPFNIIGNQAAKFYGIFDGCGHTVSGFRYKFTGSEVDNIGFFALVDGDNSEIKNLGLIEPDVNAGSGDSVALLVGRLNGTIADCYVSGGAVFGDSYVGGLAGFMTGGKINKSYSSAVVTGEHYVGGVVGVASDKGTSADCYATGNVSGIDNIGGFVGGNIGSLSRCYSTGAVTGTSFVGGFSGWGTGTVTASFWDVNTSGQTTSAGGTGLPTTQMQIRSTFTSAGWDFFGSINGPNDIWAICEGVDYPRITWQFNIGDIDDDSDVDFADFAMLGTHWRQADASFWCGSGSDFTDDGQVGLDDLAVLTEKWLHEF